MPDQILDGVDKPFCTLAHLTMQKKAAESNLQIAHWPYRDALE